MPEDNAWIPQVSVRAGIGFSGSLAGKHTFLSKHWGTSVPRFHARKPRITKRPSSGCLQGAGEAFVFCGCCWANNSCSAWWWSCQSLSVFSDRSRWAAVQEDGGDSLPDGLLCWAPGVRCHCLCHPSLAVAAAHGHPAQLLLPALPLVSLLSLHLCPWLKKQFLSAPRIWDWGRFGTAFWMCVS